jgi:urease accessory protein
MLRQGASVRERAAGRLALAIALAIAFGVAQVTPAYAHMGTGLPGGFESGFRHPLTGWDHLLAMVSVGIWGAFLGRPLIYALPVIFPVMMVGGAILGMFWFAMPPVELGIAVSVLVLGLCFCLAIEALAWAACAIVATFAVFHGYAHGMELPSAVDPVGYSVGFVLATGLVQVFGIGIVERTSAGIPDRQPGRRVAPAGGYSALRWSMRGRHCRRRGLWRAP